MRPRFPRPHLTPTTLTRVAGAILLGSVLGIGGLLWWHWHASARAREQADVAVFRSGGTWFSDFAGTSMSLTVATWRRVLIPNRRIEDPANPLPQLRGMHALAERVADDCPCAALTPRYTFLASVDAQRVWVAPAPRTDDGTLLAVGRARATTVALGAADLRSDREFVRIASGADPAGPWLSYFLRIDVAGVPMVVGAEVPLTAMADAVFGPALNQVNGRVWEGGGPWRDSVFAVHIVHRATGDTVFASGPPYPLGGTPRAFWGDGRVFEARITVNPAYVSHLIPGGFPPDPRTLILTLGSLAAALGTAGWWLLARARQLIADREAFTSGVTHELRTPLTQILLYAETVQLERADAEQRQRAGGVIVREARRLIHLVENVLLFARGQRSTMRLSIGAVSVGPLVQSALDDLAPLVEQHGARIARSIALDLTANVDADAIRQIVVNLVDNALRYGPEGQTVCVAVRGEQGRVLLTVDDEGPGVPESERTRVWQPFVRLDAGDRPRTGTGIGLAIVRQLVDLLGGTARIDDAPTGGARFIVSLPALAAGAPPLRATSTARIA
jgi:signal transduction histidine kinase